MNSAGEGRAGEGVAVMSWRSWGTELDPERLGSSEGGERGGGRAEFQKENSHVQRPERTDWVHLAIY